MEKLEEIEDDLDLLSQAIIKRDRENLSEKNRKYLNKIKRRYYRYQVEYRILTGHYYLISR